MHPMAPKPECLRCGQRVGWVGVGVNLAMVAMKIVVGITAGSRACLAEGIIALPIQKVDTVSHIPGIGALHTINGEFGISRAQRKKAYDHGTPLHRILTQPLYFRESLFPFNLVESFVERFAFRYQELGNPAVAPLVVRAVEMEGVPRGSQSGALFTGNDRHVPDIGDFISSIAADKDVIRITEFSRFINGPVYLCIIYGG